ncbi:MULTISPECIES: DUF2199 domain-containing protein [unclassified Mycolicibacterium]|uniref:DUF2199 domain-containing protein n=1 Tax=unclassified Mycolicibacterium TaxID=2636767 RepID=UPI0012DC503C|nr:MULTISPECIES: DUF2199 domain-containing protein [unclassified Mycolicibacterium]MUL80707.1 DUF2199 domain-containing protein [Mycolicibacterium sp. CBMA 329]MUL86474.1 DUF2199 domain-containing protein [Mycolicibacterium sp. CBMA 331]MUM01336.1 DUF2199 domain-containing protein [Mycolicibacterium sp. CBMA 334]MUM25846.1 DUF2199 domain-containing protein [Mycolicibacterium sp. CBMA 295]MUM36770.1 DUF2199 domain-containing protein [Mycolicibacterium sp. CBMA 247]
MSVDSGFGCSLCGQEHDALPFTYGTIAPAYWHDGLERGVGNVLTGEQCVIADEHFFIRARLILPVSDSENDFEWGVWVSLSQPNFTRAAQLWTSPERVQEPPYFGWLSTELPKYEPTTLNLKAKVHSQPVGVRPTVELEPTDHPLSSEQRTGITLARVQAIAELVLHPQQ